MRWVFWRRRVAPPAAPVSPPDVGLYCAWCGDRAVLIASRQIAPGVATGSRWLTEVPETVFAASLRSILVCRHCYMAGDTLLGSLEGMPLDPDAEALTRRPIGGTTTTLDTPLPLQRSVSSTSVR